MHAHGSCLYVNIESTFLYVVSISLNAPRCIPVCKSVPESQSNGISTGSTGSDFANQYSVHSIRVVQVWLARFYNTGMILQ